MKPKFRAKDNKGRWHYGWYKEEIDGSHWIREKISPNHYADFQIISETVGMSTTLPDKNGKEIFEGDMVTDFSFVNDIGVPYKAEIYFGDGAFRMKGNCDCIGCNGNRKVLNLAESSELEIIGNIWESEK